MEFVWTEGVKREKLFGALAYAVYVQGSVRKKKGRNPWKNDKLATFSSWKKDKREIRRKLDVKSKNFTNF